MSQVIEKKTVAIIGAGVSGIVAAVHMQKVGVRPVVFEKASNIGGMWNADIKPCWKSMRTNISKFSTALSEFPWSTETPMFPSQKYVSEYLKDYATKSLPADIFRFNTRVTGVTFGNIKWTVEYCSHSDTAHAQVDQYDFVIIASGFFDCAHTPNDITNLSSFGGTLIHSSNYHSPEQVKDRKVIIVGASMSAAEIAADMATTAKEVIHIASHSFWSIPRLIPLAPTDPVSSFLPIDFVFNRRSNRTSTHEIPIRSSADNKKLNHHLRLITGGDQQSSCLEDANEESPPFIAISDKYFEWSRGGKIKIVQGRLNKVENDGT